MRAFVLIPLLLINVTLVAQEKLTTLTVPSSPAASILGIQPSSNLKPKSFRALETALYSNFIGEDGNGIIPNDFGLEFMPYWAKPHGISLEEYLYPKQNLSQLARNSSISLASTQKFLLQDSTETKSIALGYRTSLFFPNQEDVKKIKAFQTDLSENQKIGSFLQLQFLMMEGSNYTKKDEYLTAVKTPLTNKLKQILTTKSPPEIEAVITAIYDKAKALPFSTDNLDEFYLAFGSLVSAEVGDSYEEFKKYLKARQGLSIEFACAVHLNFPDNNFNFSEVPKYSFWLNPSYTFSNELQFLNARATLRYERFYTDYFKKYFPGTQVFENNIDYGVSVTGNFEKFSIEFELTGRKSSTLLDAGFDTDGTALYKKDSSNETQYIGTFSYRLTEQIALSYQIGSAFSPVFNVDGGTLISLLSLNLGFGGPDKKDVIK